jgi:G:T-mismatch repair DNA endonuclease (very short patch repair protein)
MRTATPAQIGEQMRRIRSADTKPELVVRRIAHAMGYRFRLHRRDLPGTPSRASKLITLSAAKWRSRDRQSKLRH